MQLINSHSSATIKLSAMTLSSVLPTVPTLGLIAISLQHLPNPTLVFRVNLIDHDNCISVVLVAHRPRCKREQVGRRCLGRAAGILKPLAVNLPLRELRSS